MSFRYLFVDLAVVCTLFFLTRFIDSSILEYVIIAQFFVSTALAFTDCACRGCCSDGIFGRFAPLARYTLWCTYWVVQGTVLIIAIAIAPCQLLSTCCVCALVHDV